MTRTWAAEFSPSGVRVNTVAPGPVDTEGAPRDQLEALGATTMLARVAQPTEVASLVRVSGLSESKLYYRRSLCGRWWQWRLSGEPVEPL